MTTPLNKKSSPAEIQARFDNDVDRFTSLENGQTSIPEAQLLMELITTAACQATHPIRKVLDVGCGAGNNAIKLCQHSGSFDCDLVDLSQPMLDKAQQRLEECNKGMIRVFQGDFRLLALEDESYDIILAAAVLHHLRDDNDWYKSFLKMYNLTAPGGSVWITDLVEHENHVIQTHMWKQYGAYLTTIGGEDYREKVFNYIDKEDSPRPVTYQLELLRKVGFNQVDILYKNSCFAAFGAVKAR